MPKGTEELRNCFSILNVTDLPSKIKPWHTELARSDWILQYKPTSQPSIHCCLKGAFDRHFFLRFWGIVLSYINSYQCHTLVHCTAIHHHTSATIPPQLVGTDTTNKMRCQSNPSLGFQKADNKMLYGINPRRQHSEAKKQTKVAWRGIGNDNQPVPAKPGSLCTCRENSASAVQHCPSGFQLEADRQSTLPLGTLSKETNLDFLIMELLNNLG